MRQGTTTFKSNAKAIREKDSHLKDYEVDCCDQAIMRSCEERSEEVC
jgi:hypothetical protein